jgi:microcompartment protein CcmL/EutN
MNSRVIRTRTPPRVIAAAVLLALFLVGFLVLAIWQSGTAIEKARMTGTIIAKEFVPRPEHQVTLARTGGLRADESQGEYILTVEVAANDGTKKAYHVWVDKKRYEAAKIGNAFDVGPYLVRE